jgi:hypothetical protein
VPQNVRLRDTHVPDIPTAGNPHRMYVHRRHVISLEVAAGRVAVIPLIGVSL